jgi:hypothetical protein
VAQEDRQSPELIGGRRRRCALCARATAGTLGQSLERSDARLARFKTEVLKLIEQTGGRPERSSKEIRSLAALARSSRRVRQERASPRPLPNSVEVGRRLAPGFGAVAHSATRADEPELERLTI